MRFYIKKHWMKQAQYQQIVLLSLTRTTSHQRKKTVGWKEEETMEIAEELLRVRGIAPEKKPEVVTRIIYENANSFNTRISGNEKAEKAKEVIDEL